MWTYKSSTGQLFDSTGKLRWRGYSGCGEGLNNPLKECIRFVGPIPRGVYSQCDPQDSPKHGKFCIPLSPDEGTDTHGRDSFMMHGDKIEGPPFSASEGCIIMPRIVRNEFAASREKLQVVE